MFQLATNLEVLRQWKFSRVRLSRGAIRKALMLISSTLELYTRVMHSSYTFVKSSRVEDFGRRINDWPINERSLRSFNETEKTSL